MFSRTVRTTIVLLSVLALVPSVSLAAEHGGKEHGGSSPAAPASTSTAVTSPAVATTTAPAPAPSAPAAAAAPATPALKPIVITFSGEVSAIDTKATPAVVTVKDRYNVTKEMKVSSDAKIMEGTIAKALADLKVGSKGTFEYTYDVAKGDRTVQSISLSEAAPASAGS